MQTFFHRPGLSLAILFSLACIFMLAAQACGGDDDAADDATPSATTAASTAATTPAAFPVTFKDSSGETVTVKEAPKRIVSYSPGATEILFAVGAGPRVTAVDQFSNYPAEAKALPRVQYSKPSPEQAVALNPDLVVMSSNQEGQVPQFRALGLNVVLLGSPRDVAGVIDQVRAIGKLVGELENAEEVATSMQSRLDRVVANAAAHTTSPLVFFEVTPDLFSAGPSTFVGNLLTLLKARNVAEGAASAFPQLSAETIIKANPSVILLSDGPGSGDQSLATVKVRPGWDKIDAVTSGRVHVIDQDLYVRPGPRVIDALEELAGLLYPAR